MSLTTTRRRYDTPADTYLHGRSVCYSTSLAVPLMTLRHQVVLLIICPATHSPLGQFCCNKYSFVFSTVIAQPPPSMLQATTFTYRRTSHCDNIRYEFRRDFSDRQWWVG